MRHLSLFSGIGGFDLAAHWMGWENVAAVEKEPFCQKVLRKNFPKLKIYGDIKEFNGKPYKGTIDVISGGFPCQPFSVAGKQKAQNDDRFLWPEMLRIISEIKPAFVVCENVTGLVKLALDDVCASLENENYTCETFIIPACGIGAPHRRDRVWIIAYSDGSEQKCNYRTNIKEEREIRRDEKGNVLGTLFGTRITTNAKYTRQQEQGARIRQVHTKEGKKWKASWDHNDGRWPTKSPICGRDDGIPRELVGITFPKWRKEALKAYGNAIVPQIAFQIFKAIENTAL